MKRGFTLIELLAVIVILAIIALIATPIVLNIINDSKESATLRSAEMYITGVENSVMKKNMNAGGNFSPNSCQVQPNGNLLCDDKDTLEVEIKGEKPTSGTITFEEGKVIDVRLIYKNATIVMNDNRDLVFEEDASGTEEKTLATICTHDTTNGVAEKTVGAKYSCEVKPGTSYNFYVLKTPAEGDTTINLIMDQNINSDGTPAGMTGTKKNGENVYNLVAWNNESGQSTNAYGPVTAMQFLYNATKDWTNIDPVNYTYNDKTTQGTTKANTSYISFESTNGVATITPLTGDGITIGTSDVPLRARMPIYASDASITEVASKTDANAYLYDNLDPDGNAAPYGYWTLSSYAVNSSRAWNVLSNGDVNGSSVGCDYSFGVRAVINLKI